MNAALHIHCLDEERFPIFSDECRQSEGEYILPFIDQIWWGNLNKTILRMLTEWEFLFREMKAAGTAMELFVSLTRSEQKTFTCLELQIPPELMRILHQLEIPLKIAIVTDSEYSNESMEK